MSRETESIALLLSPRLMEKTNLGLQYTRQSHVLKDSRLTERMYTWKTGHATVKCLIEFGDMGIAVWFRNL